MECQSLEIDQLTNAPKGESSATIRDRVIKARLIQMERFKPYKDIHCNAQMTTALMQQFAPLNEECTDLLLAQL